MASYTPKSCFTSLTPAVFLNSLRTSSSFARSTLNRTKAVDRSGVGDCTPSLEGNGGHEGPGGVGGSGGPRKPDEPNGEWPAGSTSSSIHEHLWRMIRPSMSSIPCCILEWIAAVCLSGNHSPSNKQEYQHGWDCCSKTSPVLLALSVAGIEVNSESIPREEWLLRSSRPRPRLSSLISVISDITDGGYIIVSPAQLPGFARKRTKPGFKASATSPLEETGLHPMGTY